MDDTGKSQGICKLADAIWGLQGSLDIGEKVNLRYSEAILRTGIQQGVAWGGDGKRKRERLPGRSVTGLLGKEDLHSFKRLRKLVSQVGRNWDHPGCPRARAGF